MTAILNSRKYCLISPCRDEGEYLERTLASVAAQSVKPALWVIVDDGSSDDTPGMLARFKPDGFPVRVLRREDQGRRSVGPGVVDAFYFGFETIDPTEFDFICKLDMDLDLPERYFERLMEIMEEDERLGCVSGKAWFRIGDDPEQHMEQIGDHVTVGASKFYRRRCFEQIGGIVREVMWDGIDCHRARMLGFTVRSVDEPILRFEHLRPMGSSDRGVLRGRFRHGFGQYFMGTGILFALASSLFRMWTPPRITGGIAILCGYLWSMVRRVDRYGDREFRRFLRRWQWRALLHGRARATAQIEAEYLNAFERRPEEDRGTAGRVGVEYRDPTG